jgi:hypothetical protein
MSLLDIIWRDDPLLQDANTRNVFTVVNPVLFWENMSEQSRTEANKINLKFPSLIAKIYFLCRISRCMPKGGWDEWSRQCHSLSMRLPDIANQDAPAPMFYLIGWVNLDCATLETN